MVIIEKIAVTDKFKDDVKKTRNKSIKEGIDKGVKRISENPEIGKPLGYGLKGKKAVRISPYGLIYKVEGNDLLLLRFEHRKEVYD
ncbi:MAG: type II toxin-antitoxin system RelE/ParE family toxin [Candidatus Micrarchaeaceae archaeon]